MPPPSHPPASVRSQLHIRNLSAGVVYHLVFDGSLDCLSGSQLRTHLQGISQVAPSAMELFVRAAPSRGVSAVPPAPAGANDERVLLFTNTTRGAQVGLQDGATVFMRVLQDSPRDADINEHGQAGHDAPASSRPHGRQSLSRVTPPTPPEELRPSAPSMRPPAAQRWGSTHARTTAAALTPHTNAERSWDAYRTATTPPRRDTHTPVPRPSSTAVPSPPTDAGRGESINVKDSQRRHAPPMRAPSPGKPARHGGGSTHQPRHRSRSRTRIVVAPAWSQLSSSPSPSNGATNTQNRQTKSTRGSQRADRSARQAPTHGDTQRLHMDTSVDEAGFSVRMNANDLEELLAEQEYVWRMERLRFETERENRMRVVEERRRDHAYEAARLRREELLWKAKLDREQSRLKALQNILDHETEVLATQLTMHALEQKGSPARLPWHDASTADAAAFPSSTYRESHARTHTTPRPGSQGNRGLFADGAYDDDDGDEVSVDVVEDNM